MLAKTHIYFFSALAATLAALFVLQWIPLVTALLVLVFAVVLLGYKYRLAQGLSISTVALWLVAIVLGVGLGMYRPAGFNYPAVLNVNALHEGGLAFNLYINTAKLLAGYIIVYILISACSKVPAFIQSRAHQFGLAVVAGLMVVGVASQVLGLAVYVKALHYILLFAAVNLLVTCVAEEAFMRLLLQAQLQRFLAARIKNILVLEAIPLLVATLVFVLTHSVSSLNMILAFGLAGFVYGLLYSLTKNLWVCVLAHFVVNIVHFSFLTYPLAK